MSLQTTGKVTVKRYQCKSCGHISEIRSNNYGEIYPICRTCGWKHPMEMGQVHICLEPVPSGWGTPEPWQVIDLNEIVKILGRTYG